MNKEDLRETVERFHRETGYLLEVRDNELFYDGNIFLRDKVITELPDNLTVNGNLVVYSGHIKKTHNSLIVYGHFSLICTQIESLPDNLIIGSSFTLMKTQIKKLPCKLIVGEGFEMRDTYIRKLPDNLIVGGDLYVNYNEIVEFPKKLTIGGSLELDNVNNIKLPEDLIVGRDLILKSSKITKLPEKLIVVGDIDLSFSEINKLPDNLFVCGSLDISNTKIKKIPANLTICDCFDITGTGIEKIPNDLTVNIFLLYDKVEEKDLSDINRDLSSEQQKKLYDIKNMSLLWERDGVKYIKADGIFSVIDSHHGNVYKVHKLGQEDKPLYLITDGDNHWAHGDTLAEAKSDLIYKINDKDTSAYKNLTLDDTLSYEEAIAAYRTITGACSAGTRDFLENRLPSPHKDKYTIREIIKLTAVEYGGEKFEKFFENNLNNK